MQLGKLAMDCLIVSGQDLGRVCHCIAATLATLAAHGPAAQVLMGAAGVITSVMALVEVGDDEGNFSNAGGRAVGVCVCVLREPCLACCLVACALNPTYIACPMGAHCMTVETILCIPAPCHLRHAVTQQERQLVMAETHAAQA